MPGDIILGYDDTASARAALEVAVEQAKRFDERLVILFAYAPPGRSVGEEFKEHRRVLEEFGEKATAKAADMARAEGVEVEVLLVSERPSIALENAARERGARLIVVGTYGESPLRSAILGATPHKLLQFTQTPVLCVPAQEQSRARQQDSRDHSLR
jgi:nucleotide-binding universal stress UspA family protein